MRPSLGPGSGIGGRYILLEKIGEGGVGVVYRATQPALSRPVAIKLLHRSLADNPEAVRRFLDEARAATRFSHPNSITVIDSGTSDDGTPFIVMEYVRGGTLRALLRRERWLPLARVIDIARQLLAALGAAHHATVIHADIKPENVLVQPTRDGCERMKIVDFGLAEIGGAHQERKSRDLRGEWTVSGTPEYMAPEVIRGEPVTASADLYAVGALIYELLTGATPFAGGTTDDVLCRHLDDELVPPSLRRGGAHVPAELEVALARALAKASCDRFVDAETFATALGRVPTDDRLDHSPCATCGQRGPDAARFCSGCGAAGAIAPPAGGQATTTVVRTCAGRLATPRPRHERDTAPADVHVRRLNGAIGAALARGDIDEIVRGYLALSRVLVAGHRASEAIHELREGIDVVTAGRADARTRGGHAWELVVRLGTLETDARVR